MALTKTQKQKILEGLKEKIVRQKVMIFIGFTGLKVKDLFDLRKKLKKIDSQLLVVKKNLARLAFKDYLPQLSQKMKEIKGEMALVFGFGDEIQPAKIIFEFSQENQNLKILGGFFENKFRLVEEITMLAQLPTREELLAKLVGSLSALMSNLINVLSGNLRNFIYILSQIKVSK